MPPYLFLIAQKAYIHSIIDQKGLCKWLVVEILVLGGVLVLETQKSTWWILTRCLCVFLDMDQDAESSVFLPAMYSITTEHEVVGINADDSTSLRRAAAILIVALER